MKDKCVFGKQNQSNCGLMRMYQHNCGDYITAAPCSAVKSICIWGDDICHHMCDDLTKKLARK